MKEAHPVMTPCGGVLCHSQLMAGMIPGGRIAQVGSQATLVGLPARPDVKPIRIPIATAICMPIPTAV